jgi:hypothetical protein
VLCLCLALLAGFGLKAQPDARVSARVDATQITVGDQLRYFIDVTCNPAESKVQWAAIPDTFNQLEVVERGRIDTLKQGSEVTYRQRLLITGFDSGFFVIPSFTFTVVPTSGNSYNMRTDSIRVLVQTVPVDTTKSFKPIKGIILVKTTWLDYLLYIIVGVVLLALAVFFIIYFIRNEKIVVPATPKAPVETPNERALRLLNELEAKQLWQKERVKEYYIELTDIVRGYIEERFYTPALELTTDELLHKVRMHKELMAYFDILSTILNTGDLAKFAKAKPMPSEHTATLDFARQFIIQSKPVIVETTPEKS